MSMIDRPDYPYLLSRKYLKNQELAGEFGKKVAVHLHVFYVDLLEEFLNAFQDFHFAYDLWITTDVEEKKQAIDQILSNRAQEATVVVTGNIGRDVLPMLLLKRATLKNTIMLVISIPRNPKKQISGQVNLGGKN